MFKVSVDAGGTFTDAISLDEKGEIKEAKVSSTPEDPAIGVVTSLKRLAMEYGMDFREFLGKVNVILHSSTVATNAIITGKGAKIGLITTKGFKDLLELRRAVKSDVFNLKMEQPPVLVPGHLRMEVEERVDYQGKRLLPLNEEDVRTAVRKLKEEKVEGIVVFCLFSFLNPRHERRIAEIIKEECPEVHVSLSSIVLPQIYEWERLSTTVLSAYIGPVVERYTKSLYNQLREAAFKRELLLMQNNGGVESVEMAVKRPATFISSGPTAAPLSAIYFAEMHGFENVISIDMGGTSFDVAICPKRTISMTPKSKVGDRELNLETVDVSSIGAGGGSIAWIDITGTLCVGPGSAGAVPGPACYGLGGRKATVTDADLLLGYINPDYFLGGEIKLNANIAEDVVREEVAEPLRLDIVEGANAIYNIVNANMVNEISLGTIGIGYDPREFALCVGGGAGPVHAVALAQELGIRHVIIPKVAPGFTSFGLHFSDFRHDYIRTIWKLTQEVDLNELNKSYSEYKKEAYATLKTEGISEDQISLARYVHMQYYGQFRWIEVEMPSGTITKESINTVLDRFNKKHTDVFGFAEPGYPTELINVKVRAIGKTVKPALERLPFGSEDPSKAIKGYRKAFFKDDFVETVIYEGDKLRFGNVIEGPAIIEEKSTTVVIPPKWKFRVDEYGNYLTTT